MADFQGWDYNKPADLPGLYNTMKGDVQSRHEIVVSAKANLPAPNYVGQEAWVSGSSTASENGRYVSLDGTSWILACGVVVASIGTAEQSIGTGGVTYTPSLSRNDLGATVSGTNITNLPAGMYLAIGVVQLNIVTSGTWSQLAFATTGVFLASPSSEINSLTGYTTIRSVEPIQITAASQTVSLRLVPNQMVTQRLPGTITLQRLG